MMSRLPSFPVLSRLGAMIIALAILSLAAPSSASAEEAPCPERYATAQELETCLNDDACNLREKFPAEMKRRNWALKAAKDFVLATLEQEASCVTMQAMIDAFADSNLNCLPDEAFNSVSAMLYRLGKRERVIVS